MFSDITEPNTMCRHEDIRDCPLYHAMHEAGAPSCAHNDLHEGCAVDHGADYDGLVQALMVAHPVLVAQCEWNADLRHRKEQRQRNMRLLRVH